MLKRAVVVTGAPGTRWVNRTGKVRYQLIVSWQNSCGQCIARDRMIGPLWPLPFHANCRCQQLSIHPKEKAQPFIDFAARVDELPASERGRVVGVAALKLIQAGEVKWKDVVTPAGIKSLADVVRAKGLTVDRLEGAGVTRGVAARAHAAAQGTTPVPALVRVAAAEARARAQALAEAKAKAAAEAQARKSARAAASEAKRRAQAGAGAAEREASRQADLEVRARLKAEMRARAEDIRQAAAAAAAAGWTPARTLADAEAWGAARGVRAIPESPHPVTLEQWNAVNAEVAKLPPSVLDTIARAGKRLDLLNGRGITDHPELARFKGVTPRGWEGTGRTWDDIPGSGGSLQYDATVIVANRLDVGHASMNLVLHEHGHTYDASLQKLEGIKGSDTPQWRTVHTSVEWPTAYLQIPEEGYVESMAQYLHSPESRAALPAAVRSYWDQEFGT